MFQVALPPLAMGEEKRSQPGQPGLVQYQGQGYNEGFYQQQQQWLGDYNNHMSYHYNQQHHHHHQYHNQYQPQHNYHYHTPGQTVYQDTEFVGKGPSKSIAKNICAEQVLQYITTQSCSRPAPAADMDTETAADTADSDAAKPNTFETDTPWSALASLAMFKLFNDWQSQGYNLPPELMKGVAAPGPPPDVQTAAAVDKKPKLKKEKAEKTDKTEKTLPENYMSKHPVQVCFQLL